MSEDYRLDLVYLNLLSLVPLLGNVVPGMKFVDDTHLVLSPRQNTLFLGGQEIIPSSSTYFFLTNCSQALVQILTPNIFSALVPSWWVLALVLVPTHHHHLFKERILQLGKAVVLQALLEINSAN